MKEFAGGSLFFGAAVSLLAYEFGLLLKKKLKVQILNPLFISIISVILILKVFDIPYVKYEAGAKYLSYLLTPATVCLAIPLYEQAELLKKYAVAIIWGLISGVFASGACVYVLSLLFHLSHKEYVTLLPKSVTTAIGMGISEELGGHVTITIAVIVATGIIGNVFAGTALKIFKIGEPVAKGIALGSSAHALGTVKAIEIGEVEGAVSSLTIAAAGLLTAVFAPLFAHFL